MKNVRKRRNQMRCIAISLFVIWSLIGVQSRNIVKKNSSGSVIEDLSTVANCEIFAGICQNGLSTSCRSSMTKFEWTECCGYFNRCDEYYWIKLGHYRLFPYILLLTGIEDNYEYSVTFDWNCEYSVILLNETLYSRVTDRGYEYQRTYRKCEDGPTYCAWTMNEGLNCICPFVLRPRITANDVCPIEDDFHYGTCEVTKVLKPVDVVAIYYFVVIFGPTLLALMISCCAIIVN